MSNKVQLKIRNVIYIFLVNMTSADKSPEVLHVLSADVGIVMCKAAV